MNSLDGSVCKHQWNLFNPKPCPECEEEKNVDSTSDQRVVNNVMRHNYRILTDTEKGDMQRIKDLGLEFITLFHAIGKTDLAGDRLASRELSLAQTKIEE